MSRYRGSLDPVVTDLPQECVHCLPLDCVGSSDHHAVLTTVSVAPARDEDHQQATWLWHRADWVAVRQALALTDWDTIFTGDPHHDTTALTTVLCTLQQQHVPRRTYSTSPKDHSWFGYRCKTAAEQKYKAWRRYKRHSVTKPHTEERARS